MSKELAVFKEPTFGKVRIIDVDGEPWFVAKDVALALDYPKSSTTNIATLFHAVPDEWKGRRPITTLGGNQELLCVCEAGLYFFLNRSDKPKALPFQKWVSGTILPKYRKGELVLQEQQKAPQNYLEALKALVVAEEQRQKERERNKVLQDENDALDTENQQLKVETGKHPDFHRVIEDLWIVENFSHKVYGQIGRMIKALSEGLELPTYTIHHRYEHRKKVLAYHKDAYKAFRDYCRHNPDYLAKWRIGN